MGYQIGPNGRIVEVTDEGQQLSRSINESELEHASAGGGAWIMDSLEISIDASDTMLFCQNTGDIPFILDRAEINGSNVICEWTLHMGKDTDTPAGGTIIVPVNMNPNFDATPDLIARSDETALADGKVIGRAKTPIDNSYPYNLDGIILNKGQYIQFNQETTSDSGSVVLYGHFEVPA